MRVLSVVIAAAAVLSAGLALAGPGAGRAEAGRKLFDQQCKMCHAVKPGVKSVTAPNLFRIAGRKAGTGDYSSTPAIKRANITWSDKKLDEFLAGPNKMVPGTLMVVSVGNKQQRADIVAYLLTLK